MSTADAEKEQAVAWARRTVDQAVRWFVHLDVIDTAVLEAKPSWALPPRVLIAMLREQGAADHSFWLIAGADVPLDYVATAAATSAREAARHFALKWHLEAARMRQAAPAPGDSGGGSDGERLARQAELLYGLVDDDTLWQREPAAGEPGRS